MSGYDYLKLGIFVVAILWFTYRYYKNPEKVITLQDLILFGILNMEFDQ